MYSRLKSQYKNKGAVAFHVENHGRQKNTDKKTYDAATLEEKLKISEARIALLEEENDLLKSSLLIAKELQEEK